MADINNRPQGRSRGPATSSGQVNKRDTVDTGGRKAGGADYSNRPKAPSGAASNHDESRKNNRGSVSSFPNTASHSSGHNNASNLGTIVGLAAQAAQAANQNNQSHGQHGGNIPQKPVKKKKGGFLKFIILLVCIFMLISCLLDSFDDMDESTTSSQPSANYTQQTTPKPVSNAAASMSGTFHKPEVTYTDGSYMAPDTTVADGVRDRFTQIVGNGEDTVTVMVYLCGTDLESRGSMGTKDIMEMVSAEMSDKVNIILETGGTQKWNNNVISSGTNQLWKVGSGSLEKLTADLGRKQMTDPATLIDFIDFSTTNFPADRYMLIFWDHGGGSVTGYGYDQYFPNSTLSIDEIAYALDRSGTKFDFVGFDACLMASLETAVAIAPYADYMIASEETEPGTGWEYTNWLTMLARNSSTDTVSLAQRIIDDFVNASKNKHSSEKVSLSVVDLAEFEAYVPDALAAFAKDILKEFEKENLAPIAQARGVVKEFGQSSALDQMDLIDFAGKIGTSSAKELAETLQSCIKYNSTYNMKNAYGMSIFYPFKTKKYSSAALQIYDNIGMDSEYTKVVRKASSIGASSQAAYTQHSGSLFDLLGGASSGNTYAPSSSSGSYDPSDLLNLFLGGGSSSSSSGSHSSSYSNGGYSTSGSSSYMDLLGLLLGNDSGEMGALADMFGRTHVDTDQLRVTEIDGQKVISMDQKQWDKIVNIGLNVWVDDGTGYLDLGIDDVFSFDDYGNLIAEYDGLWMSVNDQAAAYYVTSEEFYSDDDYEIEGYIPAVLNGELVKLVVRITDEEPNGVILGAQMLYEEGVEAKGLWEIEDGDTVDLICDYYSHNGEFQDVYRIGETIVVGTDGLQLGTMEITGQNMIYGYRMIDQHGAYIWTEMQTYSN